VDDSEGRKALREAVDQGITFFDTALAYGNGHSERIIGEVLKDDIRAGRAVVATKIPPMNRQWPGRADYKARRRVSRQVHRLVYRELAQEPAGRPPSRARTNSMSTRSPGRSSWMT
jgi:aryl-alcohol dehydrogenase-like predicted oxidoreductase